MEVSYPLEISEDLIYTNNPIDIIVLDSRNHSITMNAMDRIHRSIGLKMFAYHYYITLDGKIYGGRPERALNPDLYKLTRATYSRMITENISPLDDIDAEMRDRTSSISSNKIVICLEGNTSSKDIPKIQQNALVNLGKDIMGRNRNIKNIYSLNEFLPMYNNLGELVDFADIRAKIKSSIAPISVITPAGTVTYKFGSRILKYIEDKNMSGNDIKLLELYLTRLGFEVLSVNGVYDLFTVQAVRDFQRSYELEITGEFNRVDFDALNKALDKIKFIDTVNHKYHRILRYRENHLMRGKDVELLNQRLQLIYPKKSIGKSYDKVTKSAVEEFQKMLRLKEDGIVGPITWNKIFDYNYVRYENVIFYDPNDEDVYNDVVEMIQQKIKSNAIKFTISELSHGGFYDRITYNNIRKIKSLVNLPVNGNIDEATFNFFNKL